MLDRRVKTEKRRTQLLDQYLEEEEEEEGMRIKTFTLVVCGYHMQPPIESMQMEPLSLSLSLSIEHKIANVLYRIALLQTQTASLKDETAGPKLSFI